MKKRIFMLALVMGVVLSMCASAWADDTETTTKEYYFKLGDTAYQGKTINDTTTKNVTVSFQVKVPYKVVASGTTVDTDYHKSANLVKWTVTENGDDGEDFTPSSLTLYRASTKVGDYTDADFLAAPYYLMNVSDEWEEGTGTVILNVEVTGTMTDLSNGFNIEVSLYSGADDAIVTSDTIESATSAATEDVDTTTVSDGDTLDPRDPDSELWDGLDPTFSNTIDTKSYDIGKNKPKLGKIGKTDLSFASGTEKDLTIPIEGPVTVVDVYVAAKDAIKLGWLAKGSTTNISLTQENIASWDIPFRVTSYDFADSVSGSTTKEIQKNWKSAENTVTLSFNGGKYAMKGFPITVSMSNSNTSSKPVTKTIKLDVTPNTVLPEWTHEVTSREITTEEETATEWGEDAVTVSHYEATGDPLQYDSDEDGTDDTDETPAHLGDEGTVAAGETFTVSDTTYILGTDNKVYLAEEVVDYYYRDVEVTEAYTKKDKPEISAVVYPSEETAGMLEGTFTVSADGPYTITVKPDDDTKLKKFFADGYTLDITQPEFDYLGNVTTPGSVYIAGTPTNTAKESKLALTLTATNPFTKKKGTLKVTASGKLAPYFEKLTDDNYITTKRVEAGKVPSVKFKAKGSKTIAYKLGNYYFDEDDKTIKAEDEDYNTELEEKLAALKLSFDAKKGAVVLLSKSDKNTLPTLNDDETAFESLDIVVTAYNNVGAAQAYASVAITGAKPAVSDKEVSFALTDEAYSYKTFKLKAGKTEGTATAEGMNILATAPDDTATTLAKYGLEMVTWDNIWVATKVTATVAAGESMPTGWAAGSADLIVSGTVTTVTTDDTTTYTAGTDGVTYYTGETTAERGTNADLKNQGIIQVVDTDLLTSAGDSKTAKGVKITVALENFGAVNPKGSIKVKVPAATSTNGALPGSNKSAPEAADSSSATKTNGTAGLTYNGAAPEADAESESEAEATVTTGAARTAADLTAGQQAFLAAKGLKVIAVLPEITANVEGQHEFPVELDEDAPEGAKMVYVPFPQNAEETEDDKIADFYGADGEPIEDDKVPADKNITVAPWLREGVTYQPVIAAKDAE